MDDYINNAFENWDKFIDPRMEELIEKEFFLEAFYLCSATLEHTLQTCIIYQEKWVKILLEKNKMGFISTPENELKKKPLGELIKKFHKYCDDEILISELNSFNSLRKDLVHHLLDEDLVKLNKRAKRKMISYFKLVSKLQKYAIEIIRKINRNYKYKIKKLTL